MAPGASTGGGGIDLPTFIVGLLIFGALAQVAYTQIVKLAAPPADTTQQEMLNATTTAGEAAVPDVL